MARRGRKVTVHNMVIEALQIRNPNIRVTGFRRNLLHAVKEHLQNQFAQGKAEGEISPDESVEILAAESLKYTWASQFLQVGRLGFVPDAYSIDLQQGKIWIYEVEDAHPLPIEKLTALLYLIQTIEMEIGLDVHLIVCDRYANETELDTNLLSWAVASARESRTGRESESRRRSPSQVARGVLGKTNLPMIFWRDLVSGPEEDPEADDTDAEDAPAYQPKAGEGASSDKSVTSRSASGPIHTCRKCGLKVRGDAFYAHSEHCSEDNAR